MGCLNWHGIRSLTKGLDASPSDGLLIKCLNVIVKTLRTRLDSYSFFQKMFQVLEAEKN